MHTTHRPSDFLFWLFAGMLLFGVKLSTGCSSTTTMASAGGSCAFDTECAGDLICVERTCVSPETTGSSSGSASSSGMGSSSSGGSSSSSGGIAGISCSGTESQCGCALKTPGNSTPCDLTTLANGQGVCAAQPSWPNSGTCSCKSMNCYNDAEACRCTFLGTGTMTSCVPLASQVCCLQPTGCDCDITGDCSPGTTMVPSCSMADILAVDPLWGVPDGYEPTTACR